MRRLILALATAAALSSCSTTYTCTRITIQHDSPTSRLNPIIELDPLRGLLE